VTTDVEPYRISGTLLKALIVNLARFYIRKEELRSDTTISLLALLTEMRFMGYLSQGRPAISRWGSMEGGFLKV
jgi:hypothetical protein